MVFNIFESESFMIFRIFFIFLLYILIIVLHIIPHLLNTAFPGALGCFS